MLCFAKTSGKQLYFATFAKVRMSPTCNKGTEGGQSRPRCEMVLGGQPRAPANLPPGKTRGTH